MSVLVRVPAAAVAASVAAAALVAGLLLMGLPAVADNEVDTERVDGADRFATAAAIARATFDDADTGFMATGENYPDALAASFAGGAVGGPILLAHPHEVPDPALAALDDLGVDEVVLVGGTAALSHDVHQQLEGEGYAVARTGSPDRYETAAQVAVDWAGETSLGELDGEPTALLASGEGFADALAAGPVAAGMNMPLLLSTSGLSDATVLAANTMQDLGVERVAVVGGPAAVGSDVVGYLDDRFTVERWAGPTRDATAAVVAQQARQRLAGFAPDVTLLARGDAFPDALAASVHSHAAQSPLLLTADADTLGAATGEWLAEAGSAVEAIRAFGGPEAVSDAVLAEAADHASGQRGDGFSAEGRASADFPDGGPAQLTDARAASHDDVDRFVLEVPGDPIGWQVEWDDDPRDPGGAPVEVDGDATLSVTVTAAADWGEGDYAGPRRVTVDGDVATEAVLTEDFEGMLTWVVGLEHEAPFRVDTLDDPQRFVLDVAAD